jgi:molecular chaperone DnaK
MSAKVTIGIDLGTSNSCIAAVVDGRPRVLENEKGEKTTPSVVHFGPDGANRVGSGAKARIILDPKNTVSSAKRLIGRYSFSEEVQKAKAIVSYEIVDGPNHAVRIRIRERDYSLPEVSAQVLREMKRIATQKLGTSVSQAVITVPAYFNDNQRQATKDAGRIAGLDVLRIINEPTAAALASGYGTDRTQRVAVYDLGGGTFDVSVLEIGEDVFEVLATCGDTFLGGDDLDDRILDLLAENFQKKHDQNVRTDPEALAKLRMAAEKAKIRLSTHTRVPIEISKLATIGGKSVDLSFELTRPMFDKLVWDLIQRTFKVCDEALQQSGLTVHDLDGVILVGGPTRLPTIREAVQGYFQREPNTSINPDEVVAVGAAVHGDSLCSRSSKTSLLDVTPLSLRLGIAGGLTETVIDRNTPVPIEQTRVFTTVRDHQEAVAVRIYQGESRSAPGNECLGEFEFTGFESMPRGEVQIEVTFAISTEGIVKVSARDPKTGAERSSTVKMSSGLSEDEIQNIIEQAGPDPEPDPEPISRPEPVPAPKSRPAPPAKKTAHKSSATPSSLTEQETSEGIELPEDEPVVIPSPLPEPDKSGSADADEAIADNLTKEEEEDLFGSVDEMLRPDDKEEL